jgi:hypothetical protein
LIALDSRGLGGRARLQRLDPHSLGLVPGTSTDLPHAASGFLLGSDGNHVAIGGENGDAYIVDLRRLGQPSAVRSVYPSSRHDSTMTLVSWPRAHRLIGVTQQFSAHSARPSQLVSIDPSGQRRPHHVDIHRSLIAEAASRNGTAVLLLGPRHLNRVGHARLLVVSPDGTRRSVGLPQVMAGFVDSGEAPSRDVQPGLAVAGGRAFIASASTIVTTGLRHPRPVSHRIPGLLAGRLHAVTTSADGSAGALAVHSRTVAALSGRRLLVSGDDSHAVRDGRSLRNVVKLPAVVDTRSWTRTHTLRSIASPQARGRYVVGSWVTGRDHTRGVIAYRPAGRRLFRRHLGRNHGFWWSDHRLTVYPLSDRGPITLLDGLTGRTLRVVRPPETNYPIPLFTWRPHLRQAALRTMSPR